MAALVAAASALLSAQQLPSEPPRQFGTEHHRRVRGLVRQRRRHAHFLVGYLNRNTTQELDVPIGPNNRIEPGGPDLGQPTHFPAGPSMRHVHRHGAEGFHAADSG